MAWFETWFNTPYYHSLYKNRDYKEAENFISLLMNELRIPEHFRIIDLACGRGRHSVYLNKLGYNVLGLDLSEENIKYDRQFENETLKFAVHDMRNEIPAEKADAVFSLFTSFGYFEDEKDDLKVFQSVYNGLKNNGLYVLDFLNSEWVKKTLHERDTLERDGVVYETSKRIAGKFVIKDIEFTDKGCDYRFSEKVRLFTPEDFEKLSESIGFQRIKVWGNYQLENFDPATSPRCINLFRKK